MSQLKSIFPFLFVFSAATCVLAQTEPQDSVVNSITDDYVAGAVLRPARVFEGELVTKALKWIGDETLLDEPFAEIREGVGLELREVEEIAVLLDRRTIYSMARIPDEDDEAIADPVVAARELKNNFKKILLAAHNFHDVYSHFPDNDGGKNDNKGNLSWRVHLLPFIDGGAPLYERFHLDEAWDSEHNKSLIDQMPDIFKTPGVDEEGKTSIHGIVGENTIMSGDGTTRMRDIIDGTSNTIMIAEAGPEKADIWTKPGGVKLVEGAPAATLGKIGETFMMARCDGSVDTLPADLDANTFRRLVTYNDGEVIGEISEESETTQRRLPTWIVKSRTPINRDSIFMSLRPMGDPIEVKIGDIASYTFGNFVLAFPDDKTLIAAPSDLLPKILKNTKPSGSFGEQIAKGLADNDLAIAVDFTNLKAYKEKLVAQIPMVGNLVNGITYIQAAADVSGTEDFIHDITAITETEVIASQIAAMAQGVIQMQKGQLMIMSNQQGVPQELFTNLLELYEGVSIEADGKAVHYRMKKPDDMDAFIEGLKPAFEEMSEEILRSRDRARAAQRKNSMKQIGLAFHNYHDVYRSFPRFNGNANPDKDEAKIGLSWRVHLLPFLDHADLYEEFALDEPWDSDTNKPLIEQMPDVFKVKGIDKPGHTSIHVFIGENTMFGDGSEAPAIQQILDGTSNTFLAVEAGTDTADIWTKPGGLKFTGEASMELVGNVNEQFLVLMSDGFVRYVRKDIDEELFNNLIQPDDGNTVGEF